MGSPDVFASALDFYGDYRGNNAESSQKSLTESGLPPAPSPVRRSLERSFTSANLQTTTGAKAKGAGKAKKKTRRASKAEPPAPNSNSAASSRRASAASGGDVTPRLPAIGAHGAEHNGDAKASRRSTDAKARRRPSQHANNARRCSDARAGARRSSAEAPPLSAENSAMSITEEGEEEEAAAPKYGFWKDRQDMKRYTRATAAVRADPRMLAPLQEQQVSSMLQQLGQESDRRAGQGQAQAQRDKALEEGGPAVPMRARRGTVVSNMLAKRRDSFTTGLETVRAGYANALTLTAAAPEAEEKADCPDGFSRLSALGDMLNGLPSMGKASPSKLSQGGKRMTRSRPTMDLNSLFDKLPGIGKRR